MFACYHCGNNNHLKHKSQQIVLFSGLFQFKSTLTVLNVFDFITVPLIIKRCLLHSLKQSKLPLSLAIMLNRLTAVTVGAGNWPALTEIPPEPCNQATRQLWGPKGAHLLFSSYQGIICLLYLSLSLLSHSQFSSKVLGE